jgi:hypothetical protein
VDKRQKYLLIGWAVALLIFLPAVSLMVAALVRAAAPR